MSIKNRKELTENQIREALDNTDTMVGAAKYLDIDWRTFRYYAQTFGLYNPKERGYIQKYKMEDVFAGKHRGYSTSHLSKRLVKDGYKTYKCERCGLNEWLNLHISLQLNHIDGNNGNHKLDNLELLCPNCHSQTDTYGSKNIKRKRIKAMAEKVCTGLQPR